MYRDQGVSASTYNGRWDAESIHGCECDAGHQGFDCSLKTCNFGDDPMTTGQQDEVQLLRCSFDPAVAGKALVLRFRRETTAVFDGSASASQMEALLEALQSINDVSVTFRSASGAVTSFCDSSTSPSSNIVEIRFLTETGDVPDIQVLNGDGTALSEADKLLIVTAFDGTQLARGGDNAAIVSVRGSKEWTPCSGRGRCETDTGVCQCYTGFASSNRRGDAGDFADCGFASQPITSCPGMAIECSGHGRCSGHPQYVCTCEAGWIGGDCGERTCPAGKAWFDLASAADLAHSAAECSNRGNCDRTTGQCRCQEGFSGEACSKLQCPGTDAIAGTTCSGHGFCYTMAGMAQEATTNGVHTPFTYGRDRNSGDTWDHDSNQGCICNDGFHGYDCSLRSCPVGDDPTTTGQYDEVQTLDCAHVGGAPTFKLRFRRQTTGPISFAATAMDVAAALEGLSTIGKISVTFTVGHSQACSSTGTNTMTFSFSTENGDVPSIEVVRNMGYTQGTDLNFSPVAAATESTKGTTETDVCSGRGLCNHITGNCECFIGFGSSDGSGGAGGVADCGYREPFVPTKSDRTKIDARTAAAIAWANANKYGGY